MKTARVKLAPTSLQQWQSWEEFKSPCEKLVETFCNNYVLPNTYLLNDLSAVLISPEYDLRQ